MRTGICCRPIGMRRTRIWRAAGTNVAFIRGRERAAREGSMRCLHCDKEITAAFISEWEVTEAAGNGRFRCPHCDAEHIRREIAPLPSGERQFTFRLWGHLANRRKKPPTK